MMIDLAQHLRDHAGEPIRVGTDEEPLSLGRALCLALMTTADMSQGSQPDGEKKLERFLLAQRIANAEHHVDLSSTQMADLRKLLGVHFITEVAGAAMLALEPLVSAEA